MAEGVWYEGDWEYAAALLDLSPTSSGRISVAAMWWHMATSLQPLVSLSGFDGAATMVGSNMDHRNDRYIELSGDGSKTTALFAGNDFVHGGDGAKNEVIWKDTSNPVANAVNMNFGGLPVTRGVVGQLPTPEFVTKTLAQLRAVRIAPPTDQPAGVTDVKIFRVNVSGGDGKDAVRFEAGAR